MKLKGLVRLMSALLVCASLFCAMGCKKQENEAPAQFDGVSGGGLPEYDTENIGEYVKPFEYTGHTVYYTLGETAQEKLWSAISEGADIISYPAAQVEYYAEQERAKYRYYASRDGVGYNELLAAMGVTEESIVQKAKALVKDDLILAYIVKDADISVSDEEKTELYGKYVEHFAELYGYDKTYVSEKLTEQIYDAMLYDKTMEYLLKNNTAHTTQSK